ncbi:TetR/AcrR family transcriptional regulator [Actinacidiphila yeochonensis]|uniref:TetR/AcrR family transcriptional regulator n=1 Tax=Actinacidiphila yeochonensis TaxID=89050 RepID=UPI00056461E9|nr:TetR/AcrR family transcriptional regulator [Actinacidiphila yeochonensis]
MAGVTETRAPRLPGTRADALRNRERILAAAIDTFVESGPEAPLDDIARRAGVGSATLYRHFADRRALVRQALALVAGRVADSAEAIAADVADPFTALRRFAHAAADQRVGVLCGMFGDVAAASRQGDEAQRDRLAAAVGGLTERARRAGQLRPDVATEDFLIALAQLVRPLPGPARPSSDAAVHRRLEILLDGLRAVPASPAVPERPAVAESPEPSESREPPA